MKLTQPQTINLKNKRTVFKNFTLVCLVVFLGAATFFTLQIASAQSTEKSVILPPTPFKIGEKLTYTVSFGRFKNAGYAEIYTVSRGKLNERDSVELQSKFKTSELVSAVFYFLDESRTTFAAADSGLPLYIRKTSNPGALQTETISNFLAVPTQNYDLLTLIYKLRNAGGTGNFLMQEDDKIYAVSAQTTVSEKVKTDAGEYDTTVSTVQSEYFTSKGLKDFRINFSADEQKVPVSVRFKTAKGEFLALLASVQMIADPETQASPKPVITPTPLPVLTPTPTPTPSLDNQPLSANLPFVLGETLEYRLTSSGQNVGAFLLQAKERRTIDKKDILFLSATIMRAEKGFGIFNAGDSITAQVNAESLVPYQFEAKFTGALSSFNQSVRFDQERGIALSGAAQTQVPLNTHSLLSLIYAVRSFNLRAVWDPKNPIMDTRVSVFYDGQFYVFTIRPLEPETITINNEKISAQMISAITGNPQLDALNLRIWLSNNEKRTPLRFSIGNYQADLVSETIVQPK